MTATDDSWVFPASLRTRCAVCLADTSPHDGINRVHRCGGAVVTVDGGCVVLGCLAAAAKGGRHCAGHAPLCPSECAPRPAAAPRPCSDCDRTTASGQRCCLATCAVPGCAASARPGSDTCAEHQHATVRVRLGRPHASCNCAARSATTGPWRYACSRCPPPTPRIPHPPADSSTGAPPRTPGAFSPRHGLKLTHCGVTLREDGRCSREGCLFQATEEMVMRLPLLPVPRATPGFSDTCHSAGCNRGAKHAVRLSTGEATVLCTPCWKTAMDLSVLAEDYKACACRPEDKQACDVCQREATLDARIADAKRRIEHQQSKAAASGGPRRMAGLSEQLQPVVTPHFAVGVLEQAREHGGLSSAVRARLANLVANLIRNDP